MLRKSVSDTICVSTFIKFSIKNICFDVSTVTPPAVLVFVKTKSKNESLYKFCIKVLLPLVISAACPCLVITASFTATFNLAFLLTGAGRRRAFRQVTFVEVLVVKGTPTWYSAWFLHFFPPLFVLF